MQHRIWNPPVPRLTSPIYWAKPPIGLTGQWINGGISPNIAPGGERMGQVGHRYRRRIMDGVCHHLRVAQGGHEVRTCATLTSPSTLNHHDVAGKPMRDDLIRGAVAPRVHNEPRGVQPDLPSEHIRNRKVSHLSCLSPIMRRGSVRLSVRLRA